jgi:cytochrome b6-f complex iron-sulfur subunit
VAVAIAIVVILIVGVISVVLLANRSRSTTGALSRETRRRDSDAADTKQVSTSTELEATGRERAQETRETMGGGVATRTVGQVTRWEPVDEEELGVSRRQFLNRAVLTVVGFAGIGAFAPAMLAFLWPSGSAGFGGKINAGSTDEILAEIDEKNAPKYVPEARAYVQRYPKSALGNAEKVYPPLVLAGMEKGVIALYQKCPHLGCRVPWCQSSQWFECPCHGSKYNRVGEKKAGPAPRGMDHFPVEVGATLTIDTGIIELGPPIGTNTTGQQQEGPLCV